MTTSAANPEVPAISILHSVFPVVALVGGTGGELARQEYFGTAFAIAPGVFLTAAHVVQVAQSVGELAISGPSTDVRGALGAVRIDHTDVWDDIDVAVLYCGVQQGVTFFNVWSPFRIQVLEDLASFGFPHAFTAMPEGSKRLEVVFRGFKGHIITTRNFERLPGTAVYEVSTPCPEGMSGAPALWHRDGQLILAGIVIGESIIKYRRRANRAGLVVPVDQFAHRVPARLDHPIGGFAMAAVLVPNALPPTGIP